MFGYLQTQKSELLIKDYEAYKSVYCGLCKQLGKSYGVLSRLTLSYDCTFLALLYISINDDDICVKKGHCVVNPLKKCMFCTENKALKFAAAVSAILTYYKIKDNISDSKFLKALFFKFLSLFFRRAYKKAKKDYPVIEEITAQYIQEQFNVEHDKNVSIDIAANPTANFISKLIMSIPNTNNIPNLLLEKFGYFIGRWVYLIDAADDYDKDLLSGNFNPFVDYFKNKENTRNDVSKYCNSVLNFTIYQINLAYNLIDFKQFKRILDNIINYGLPDMQRKCLFYKPFNKKKK